MINFPTFKFLIEGIFSALIVKKTAVTRINLVHGSSTQKFSSLKFLLRVFFLCLGRRETCSSRINLICGSSIKKKTLSFFFRWYIFFCRGRRETYGSPPKPCLLLLDEKFPPVKYLTEVMFPLPWPLRDPRQPTSTLSTDLR